MSLNRWVLYHTDIDWDTKNYEEMFKVIGKFDCFEDFAKKYDKVKPSELLNDCDYFFFREGIKPVIEDDHNIEGGRFLLDHLCLKKVTFEDFNSYWLNIIAFMMKCYMPAGLGINGAVVRVRPHRKTIAIWIKDGEDVELITCVEKFLREKFCLKHVQYARHRELECKAEIRKKKKEGQRVVPVIPESEDPRTFTVMTFVTFVDDTKK